ncbi:MAG TPA: proton-conducting transporter membrane subunit [Tepidisphaeraceae bacterium]|jgi:NADH:ubiquinone oxidoreductase subunit 5 (subunit L)/multisubunit Na+/H+ antiporter MnhA subunit
MPFTALLLILAALLPLASCLTLVAIGRRLATPLAGYVATFCVALSFLCSGWGLLRWLVPASHLGQEYGKSVAPIILTWPWVPIGSHATPNGFLQDHPGWLDMCVYVDSLTIALFVTVTFSAMLVHIFAVRSLRRDPRFTRFFACLSLACFATLALILSGSALQMVILLELVGFAASLMIAFRSDDEAARRAAAKMFVVNRVGDIGLLVGLGILVSYVGSLSLPELWMMLGNAASGAAVVLPNGAAFPPGALTAAGIALFWGAAARCAQFPLHVWAGDAAEGIAPAVATVFAMTLSLAGLYLIARLFPLFTPSARLLIAIVGVTTMTMTALIATAQPDIKKSLAFIAASQLGLMVLGVGVGSWTGAMFHLIAAAFAQTLLFLAAGAVIRAARGETQLSQYGGLFARMPVTAITAALAGLAVCGVGWRGLGLSGYFSRGLILRHTAAFASLAVGSHRSGAYWAFFAFAIFATFIVAFATARWWMLVFAGRPRDRRLYDHAREVPTLLWPLVVFAIMTALAGNWLGIRDMLESAVYESRQAATMQNVPNQPDRGEVVHAFDAVWPAGDAADEGGARDEPVAAATSAALTEGTRRVSDWVWPATALGILCGLLLYFRGDRLAGRLTRIPPVSWLHTWLFYRMYFDELYGSLFVAPVLGLAAGVAWFDRNVIEPIFNRGGQDRRASSPAPNDSRERADENVNANAMTPPVDTTTR